MSRDLIKQGGAHKVKKVGRDSYSMSIRLPEDEHGRVARKCPNGKCSPGYFKAKKATGVLDEQITAYCPYCRHSNDPSNFATNEQLRYANDIIMRELGDGMEREIRNALGLGSSGRKQLVGGMLPIELSLKSNRSLHVRRPFEEELLRAVICPHCGLDHAVFGLAIWCPNCGKDILMTHVNTEYNVIRIMLGDVERRKNDLGPRIAARDVENCLEDTVSIFEAVLKAFLIRYLNERHQDSVITQSVVKQIRTRFQNPRLAEEFIKEHTNISLFENITSEQANKLNIVFEKRHPITHNLGVIDKKYLEKAVQAEKEGREIRVTNDEILQTIDISYKILNHLHSQLFPQN